MYRFLSRKMLENPRQKVGISSFPGFCIAITPIFARQNPRHVNKDKKDVSTEASFFIRIYFAPGGGPPGPPLPLGGPPSPIAREIMGVSSTDKT